MKPVWSCYFYPPLPWLILTDVSGPLANVVFEEGGNRHHCRVQRVPLCSLSLSLSPLQTCGVGRSSPRAPEEVPVTPYLFKSMQKIGLVWFITRYAFECFCVMFLDKQLSPGLSRSVIRNNMSDWSVIVGKRTPSPF